MTEAQRACGNHDLGRPAIRRPFGPGVPNAVPIEGGAFSARNQTVNPSPRRINLKEIAGAVVAIGIEDDADGIVAAHVAIALHPVNGDTFGLKVVAGES